MILIFWLVVIFGACTLVALIDEWATRWYERREARRIARLKIRARAWAEINQLDRR